MSIVKKLSLLLLLISYGPAFADVCGFCGSDPNHPSNSAWGLIGGSIVNQTDLQNQLNGKVSTTGAETIAGVKTFSSAPIFSSLSAQAIPYLNASKQWADGAWREADTTFATTFTPAGVIATAGLTLDFSTLTSALHGLRITGGEKTENAFRVEATYPSSTLNLSASAISISGIATGTALRWGSRVDNFSTCTGDVLGFTNGGQMCASFVGDTAGVSAGLNTGVYGSASRALHNVGGGFEAVMAAAGAGNRTIALHATASGENSAQMTAVYGKIATVGSSALSNANPGLSSAAVFDNGDTTANIFTAMDNGSSVSQIQDGGITVIGANGSTVTHVVNGNLSIGSSLTIGGGITVATSPAAPYRLVFPPTQGAANTMPLNDGNGNLSWASTVRSVGITIDGGGSAITTGLKGYIEVPYNGTIKGWTALADVSGSAVVDVWKAAYANYPPTVSNTIAGSEKPTVSAAIKGQDLALSTWSVTVTAGDIIAFSVDSASTITKLSISLQVVPR